jgi:hypothetical protein
VNHSDKANVIGLLALFKLARSMCMRHLSPARVLHPNAVSPTYLDLQEVLRDAIDLLEALRVRVCACTREASRHEL